MKKLYGDFNKNDWMNAMNLQQNDIPKALIVHGEWEFENNLKNWSRILGPNIKRPEWNTLLGEYNNKKIGFSNVFWGPVSALISHPFCVMGTELLIQTGYIGGLSFDINYGDILIVSKAEMEDGVSNWYYPNKKEIEASSELVEEACKFCELRDYPFKVGSIISISRMLLETSSIVESWAAKGHLGADGETAATYSVAKHFKRKSIALLNLSDHICHGDTFYNYTDERIAKEKETDKRIREIALHLSIVATSDD